LCDKKTGGVSRVPFNNDVMQTAGEVIFVHAAQGVAIRDQTGMDP
jgi:hypothetical protein